MAKRVKLDTMSLGTLRDRLAAERLMSPALTVEAEVCVYGADGTDTILRAIPCEVMDSSDNIMLLTIGYTGPATYRESLSDFEADVAGMIKHKALVHGTPGARRLSCEISVDVSTGDHDAEARVFANVLDVIVRGSTLLIRGASIEAPHQTRHSGRSKKR